jgi:hypothetical protein
LNEKSIIPSPSGGKVRGGVSNIRNLSSPPTWKGVFVQALNNYYYNHNKFSAISTKKSRFERTLKKKAGRQPIIFRPFSWD